MVYPTSDLRRYNIWKMSVTFPDGSAREFRPNGYDDEVDDGYFRVQPAPGMTYYSIDGTYARLDFGATTNDWTLYFPDGSRVLRQGALQRTYDRNGNYTEIYDVANYNGTGHAATVAADQLGRSITVEFGTNEDYIHMQGMGQLLTTTVKWTNTYVTKQYRAGNHFQYTVNLTNKVIKVVGEIALPSQLGGNLKYTFGYNGWPVTGMGTSVGWGELSSIVLPSGATAAYRYKRDNVSGSGIPTTWILDNSPIEKKLEYLLEYDGVSSPAPTETWTYDLNDLFKQAYNYDRWVNRTINATDTFNVPEPQFDPSRLASNNQLYGLGENFGLQCPNLARSMCYDAAGNLTRDVQIQNSGFLVYDAENRMTRPNSSVAQSLNY